MSLETLPDGRQAVRLEVRSFEDGITRAAMQMTSGEWCVLCTVMSPPHDISEAVRKAFFELARAVVTAALAEAGVEVKEAVAVPPGAPLDVPKH